MVASPLGKTRGQLQTLQVVGIHRQQTRQIVRARRRRVRGDLVAQPQKLAISRRFRQPPCARAPQPRNLVRLPIACAEMQGQRAKALLRSPRRNLHFEPRRLAIHREFRGTPRRNLAPCRAQYRRPRGFGCATRIAVREPYVPFQQHAQQQAVRVFANLGGQHGLRPNIQNLLPPAGRRRHRPHVSQQRFEKHGTFHRARPGERPQCSCHLLPRVSRSHARFRARHQRGKVERRLPVPGKQSRQPGTPILLPGCVQHRRIEYDPHRRLHRNRLGRRRLTACRSSELDARRPFRTGPLEE